MFAGENEHDDKMRYDHRSPHDRRWSYCKAYRNTSKDDRLHHEVASRRTQWTGTLKIYKSRLNERKFTIMQSRVI